MNNFKSSYDQAKLILKHLKGALSAEEQDHLDQWLLEEENKQLFERVTNEEWVAAELETYAASDKAEVRRKLLQQIRPKSRRLWPSVAAAASIMIAVAAGTWYYTRHQDSVSVAQPGSMYVNDIAPGRNSATLTLSSGKKIVLSDSATGELAEETGVVVNKTSSGQLVYTLSRKNNNKAAGMNTLSTAKGETYQVILPDQSKVWLNALSSITYPGNFASLKERRVKLTGEAYFEISKDKAHPFIVKTDKQEVTVLGTHFNVNAYTDEPETRTTLLEGSVHVAASASQYVLLKPGQQSALKGTLLQTREVDAEKEVAWKNGGFRFDNEGIESVMRTLARWYDLDVQYEGKPTAEVFVGEVSRSKNISQVLKLLDRTGAVHFRVEGRKVTVTK
jgi:transmembrane sensor